MIPFLLKYWKHILLALLLVTLLSLVKDNIRQRKENIRLADNLEQITAKGQRELILSKGEYEHINARWKTTLDSTLEANRIKIKNVRSATVIQTVYRDTGTTKIVYKDVIQMPDKSFKVPFSFDEKCVGMKGFVLTLDPTSKVEITERTVKNSISLVVVQKRFLGFLWVKKKSEFKAFSDCGEMDVTKIDFKK